MSLERYWQAFSNEQHEVSGAVVLENRGLPILEVNAGYPNTPGQILEIKRCYAARGRPAVLILPEGSTLELEASNAQFVPHAGFTVLECECECESEPDWTKMLMVEQVGWSAASMLARSWSEQVQSQDWEKIVASEIARVMSSKPQMTAYVAFEEHKMIGMGIVFEGSVFWLAGDSNTKAMIVKRAAFDAGGSVFFSVPFDELLNYPPMRQLERYVFWTEATLG